MANSHIPKFGNWENDDIPYSAYFNNARKDNPIGNVRINSNDPDENIEAFTTMMLRRGSSRSLEGYNASHDHNLHASVLPMVVGQPQHRLMKSTSTTKTSRHADEHTRINLNDPEKNPEAFRKMMQRRGSSRSLESYNATHDHNLHASVLQAVAVGQPPHKLMKSTSMTKKSRHADEHTWHHERHTHHKNSTIGANSSSVNHKSSVPESGRELRTSSDYSLLSPPNQGCYVRSDDRYKKKSSTTSSGSRGSDSFSSALEQAGKRRHRRSTSHHSSDHQQQHHRAASIPKFGSWDVNDRKSGEGFTVIFDNMKEEKQSNAAANYKVPSPTTSPPRQPSTNKHKDQRDQPGIISSCISKICGCCMSSSGSK